MNIRFLMNAVFLATILVACASSNKVEAKSTIKLTDNDLNGKNIPRNETTKHHHSSHGKEIAKLLDILEEKDMLEKILQDEKKTKTLVVKLEITKQFDETIATLSVFLVLAVAIVAVLLTSYYALLVKLHTKTFQGKSNVNSPANPIKNV